MNKAGELSELVSSSAFIVPDWPSPPCVAAAVTTRFGGTSAEPYDSFNLATHVGDETHCVIENRKKLCNRLQLSSEPFWLEQIHSAAIIPATVNLQKLNDQQSATHPPKADASYTRRIGGACVVLTADCLPVLICNTSGTQVAAVHAGWRGLANGIIENAINTFAEPKKDLLVWLGPAISQPYFEVGEDVKKLFENKDATNKYAFIAAARPSHWYGDLFQLAKNGLKKMGVHGIYGGEYCTYSSKGINEEGAESERFFSYRRDGETGRMASLIWLKKNGRIQ